MIFTPQSVLAASFTVNTTATVVEGNTDRMVCVQMIATPAEAILEKEVLLTLSSMDGTGISKINS